VLSDIQPLCGWEMTLNLFAIHVEAFQASVLDKSNSPFNLIAIDITIQN